MIEIRKVNDEGLAKNICQKHGVEWKEGFHVIATIEAENIVNSAVFEYTKETGTIHAIDGFDDDLAMLDGLCRAILNIMDINGVKDV